MHDVAPPACTCSPLQVALALARLDALEGGYRDFHAAMTRIVRDFPRTVAEANDM